MIPRLFEKDARTFTNFGLCPLVDCIECMVTEVRNGEYTLSLEYPRDGQFAQELKPDRIILADPADDTAAEPFRITEVSFDMNGNIDVQAEHISYQLNDVIIGKCSRNTRYPAGAWERADENKLTPNPFTFYTDMTDESQTVHQFGCDVPRSMRHLVGDTMIGLYGGELKWVKYQVNFLKNRGQNNGVKIAYTKNLTGLEYDIDISDVYTGAVAYYSNTDTYVQGTVQTIANDYSFNRVQVLNASTEFDSAPTAAQLNQYAADWLASNGNIPSVSVDVKFVPLWQTEEYKDFYGLEHVSLCDTVEVIYPPLNLDVTAKVVKTVYDVLADRYDEVVVSSIKATLADTIYDLMRDGDV